MVSTPLERSRYGYDLAGRKLSLLGKIFCRLVSLRFPGNQCAGPACALEKKPPQTGRLSKWLNALCRKRTPRTAPARRGRSGCPQTDSRRRQSRRYRAGRSPWNKPPSGRRTAPRPGAPPPRLGHSGNFTDTDFLTCTNIDMTVTNVSTTFRIGILEINVQ